jgi:protein-disulfide isomerase-like protein with CxxC motif
MTAFEITYDYLCPFARIANEAVVEAIERGANYDVTFAPFSLTQNHLTESDTPVWDKSVSDAGRGVHAHYWGIAVRDNFSDRFNDFHVALFNAKHDDLLDIDDPAVLASVAHDVGLDAAEVAEIVASGVPAKTLAAEHMRLVQDHSVFGVPTFIANDEAVFVRFMQRHELEDLDKVVGMVGWTNVNEFKRTKVPR